MKTLLIAEKPTVARDLLSGAPKEITNNVTVLCPIPYGAIKPLFPRSLPLSSVPIIEPPRFELVDESILYYVDLKDFEARKKTSLFDAIHYSPGKGEEGLLTDFFNSFDRIYVGMDPDHTGQIAISQFLEKANINIDSNHISYFWILSLWHEDVKNYWATPITAANLKLRDHFIKAGEVKRYVDYQWAVNSLPLFSFMLARQDLNSHIMLSKYHLLTLTLFNEDSLFTEGDLVKKMAEYKGTGKYAYNAIGSLASRVPVVTQLAEMGILKKLPAPAPSKGSCYQLSEKGQLFKASIHKKTIDPDLPGRLNSWMKSVSEQGVEPTKKLIDRYIRTVFGKQKNKISR